MNQSAELRASYFDGVEPLYGIAVCFVLQLKAAHQQHCRLFFQHVHQITMNQVIYKNNRVRLCIMGNTRSHALGVLISSSPNFHIVLPEWKINY